MNIKETRINFKALIVWIEDRYEYFFFLQNSKFLYQKSILGGLLKQIKITIFFFKNQFVKTFGTDFTQWHKHTGFKQYNWLLKQIVETINQLNQLIHGLKNFDIIVYSSAEHRPMNTMTSSGPESQLRSRQRAAKMLIAIVVVFAVCYLPVHVLNLTR